MERWRNACPTTTQEWAGRNAYPTMYLIPNFLFFAEGLILVKNKLKFQQAKFTNWHMFEWLFMFRFPFSLSEIKQRQSDNGLEFEPDRIN